MSMMQKLLEINDEAVRLRAECEQLRSDQKTLQEICAVGRQRIAELEAERDEAVEHAGRLQAELDATRKQLQSSCAGYSTTTTLPPKPAGSGLLRDVSHYTEAAEVDTPAADDAPAEPENCGFEGKILREVSQPVQIREGRVSQPESEPEPEQTTSEQIAEIEGQTELQPVQIREGRWRTRCGEIRHVTPAPKNHSNGHRADRFLWHDAHHNQTWLPNGHYHLGGESRFDLLDYLGPIEVGPQPEPEQASPAGYTPPEGWRLLQVGEVIEAGDEIVHSHSGRRQPTRRAGNVLESGPRYIRRIRPQSVQNNIPGHIWLTDAETGSPVLVSLPGVAQASEYGAHWIPAGMGGWHVTVKETPDQIASLIQQEWYGRNSMGGAASAANAGGLIGVL